MKIVHLLLVTLFCASLLQIQASKDIHIDDDSEEVVDEVEDSDEQEGTCSLNAKGEPECGKDGGEDKHNVWTTENHENDGKASTNTNEPSKPEADEQEEDLTIDKPGDYVSRNQFKRQLDAVIENQTVVELEFILAYIDLNGDRRVQVSELDEAGSRRPELIVKRVLEVFKTFDADDDGFIIPMEVDNVLGSVIPETETLLLFMDVLDIMTDDRLNLLGFMKVVSKMGKRINNALEPYKQLDYLNGKELETVIKMSPSVFIESDANDDGFLDTEEYKKSTSQEAQNGVKMTDEQKKQIFEHLDTDKDEKISFQEFQVMLPRKPPTTEEKLEAMFKHIDVDKNDLISQEELRTHLTQLAKVHGSLAPKDDQFEDKFVELDKDEDGQLSIFEMRVVLEQAEQIQKQKYSDSFKEIDLDENGYLDEAEVAHLAKTMESKAEAFSQTGQKVEPEKLMKMLDVDSDGKVSPDEMQQIIQRFSQMGIR